MPLTLDVDGKTVQNPSLEDIAKGFASIDAEGSRLVSIIMLQRLPITLWAFGHPKEGYTLDISEDSEPKGGRTSKVTSPAKPISHEEVVKLFQDFARNDDSWQNKYQWEPGIGEMPAAQVFRRVAVLVGIFVLLVLLLKFWRKLF